ncbi:MAG: hypothetical protein P0Y52_13130 [Candidatus Brevundimonas phytovorans]|nr:hypothetical protein [Brevundimonas sp.]WEK57468.1 MAG: hypothetical protein P0Y52_13130 [Brevundimonas sp.]
MKTSILAAMLGASLLAMPVAAQTATTPPGPTAGAAATLPDAFGQPAPTAAPLAAAPAAPVAEAPDIARSEQALRAAIASFQSGNVDYSVFSDDLAVQIREQAGNVTPLVQQFGALKSINHVGQQDGADLFRVVFEKQTTDWVIAFDEDNQIAALLFRPARD